ncbi:hypothetical protein H4684_003615 [Desulfomicrobium macestii]|uniref:Uncharacterized protein n=1 Tax=Desulfomicrobium macestii TaxID=90731 RepID=A0ABR9H879_9BACT|nr:MULTISPECIES: hypothetical protein [Desulfomicrobium]MBE1426931.1 hypothetical protein [Desulfomicrobium macestii]
MNSPRKGVLAPALRNILSEGTDEQLGGFAVEWVRAASGRVWEDVIVGGIGAENYQLPYRQASCMDHEGLEVMLLEILVSFRVDWPCEECFKIQMLVEDV